MTINATLLVALGFLCASILAVLLAPAYRRRTVRLTTQSLKRALPLTQAELQAQKDSLRAEHAIVVHNLETRLESVTLNSARQKIEVNRRDARISELEGVAERQGGRLAELENARRVLEQTVMDRLPRIEARLGEAKTVLAQRDREVASLAATAQSQARAIGEAAQLTRQQTGEIERLSGSLAARIDPLGATSEPAFEGESALRADLEATVAKGREQASLIARLQDLVAKASEQAAVRSALPSSSTGGPLAEVAKLELPIAQVQADVGAIRASMAAPDGAVTLLTAERETLKREVARLTTALAIANKQLKTKDATPTGKPADEAAESRANATIAALRGEVAALNDSLARQSANFLDETKRLNALLAAPPPEVAPVKRPLADRILDRSAAEAKERSAAEARKSSGAQAEASSASAAEDSRRAEVTETRGAEPRDRRPRPRVQRTDELPAEHIDDRERADQSRVVQLTPLAEKKALIERSPPPQPTLVDSLGLDPLDGNLAGPAAAAAPRSEPAIAVVRRPRLLDRITSIEKPSSRG